MLPNFKVGQKDPLYAHENIGTAEPAYHEKISWMSTQRMDEKITHQQHPKGPPPSHQPMPPHPSYKFPVRDYSHHDKKTMVEQIYPRSTPYYPPQPQQYPPQPQMQPQGRSDMHNYPQQTMNDHRYARPYSRPAPYSTSQYAMRYHPYASPSVNSASMQMHSRGYPPAHITNYNNMNIGQMVPTFQGDYQQGGRVPIQRDVCPICNKKLRGNMKLHMRTHTDERPFVCDICNKAFKQKGNMKRHRKVHLRMHERSENKDTFV
mmetsp:Transcript_30960/g.54292  ORF Transcript_30960/g.54292 Transcript_30960/m.54292 type:complete len:262 (-) Transcript_30960:483-1268(-)|eukprot:CAMPEP_0197517752 /NCGR_PEP_ID=MMETSP1318-20131121/2821_1 /TAXON_ID=552666 /ORGANISM="Partenskyella glossopodia, Strain RCC365" /LENGTH=261 /DNA_ID=CAMNT_0043067575 /DNA_START=215 /DNA_END=1000 /DNA_ORIENTATION=+